MKKLLLLLAIVIAFTSFSQDVITWSTQKAGKIDTIALENYVPVKDGIIYQEYVVNDSSVSKKELYSRAKLAIQKVFLNNKSSTANYDEDGGIVSVNNFYEIYDNALASKDVYSFIAILSIIAKDGKYKIKLEIENFINGSMSTYETNNDFQNKPFKVSALAGSYKFNQKQRARVLKTLNEKMMATFNSVKKEMSKKTDNNF